MRTWPLLLGCLAIACGGNFSNGDLEFLNALPMREDLSAKLPGAEGFARKGSSRQRVDLLAQGEHSQLYATTRQAADDFNTGLDGVFYFLEGLRKNPPTTRAPALRIWGPMEDPNHPGYEVRFTMTREAERFDHRLEFRLMGSDEGAWWSAAVGRFQADGGLRKGSGQMSILLAEMRAHGIVRPLLMDLERLDIEYQTHALPISVRMHFVPASPGRAAEIRYGYRELPGGPGEMRFLREDTDVFPGEQKEKVTVLSRWTRDQGGKGLVEATGGDLPAGSTATLIECWDASFRLTYMKRSWEPDEVGNASSCPDVSMLED